MESIIKLLSEMSLEELLEIYKNADNTCTIAEANLMRLLVTMELDKRIEG